MTRFTAKGTLRLTPAASAELKASRRLKTCNGRLSSGKRAASTSPLAPAHQRILSEAAEKALADIRRNQDIKASKISGCVAAASISLILISSIKERAKPDGSVL